MSQQERRTTADARRVGKLSVAALLGLAAIGPLDPGPAHATCSGNKITNVRISAGRADFGEDPHLLGSPTNSGRICWSWGGNLSGAILEGQLYYDDLLNKGLAHILVWFRTSSGTASSEIVSEYRRSVCSTGGLRQTSVFSQVNGRVDRITIQLSTSERADGPRTAVGTKAFTI